LFVPDTSVPFTSSGAPAEPHELFPAAFEASPCKLLAEHPALPTPVPHDLSPAVFDALPPRLPA
jgi:hypothetical protein